MACTQDVEPTGAPTTTVGTSGDTGLIVGTPPVAVSLPASDDRSDREAVEGAEPEEPEDSTGRRSPSTEEPEAPTDTVLDRGPGSGATRMVGPDLTFDGLTAGYTAADAVGDIGSDHYVEVVNKRAAVYDRSGRLQVGPFTMNQLFTDAAKEWEDDICATTNEGDPVVAYDERAGVFVMSQFAFRTVEEPNADGEQADRAVGPGTSCIAVYDPQAPAEERVCVSSYTYSQDRMYDYPKLGVWGDHYLLSAVDLPDRRFATDRDRLVEFQLVAIDRQGLLDCAGAMRAKSVTVARANDDERYWLALDADGEEPPTAPPTFVAYVDEPGEGQDELHLLSFTPDFTESAQDPTEVSSVPVDSFTSYLCEWRLDCLPQPSTVQGDEGAKLDAVSDRLMNRAVYRQDGDVGRLVLSHTVNVGSPADLAGVRWYQLEYDGSAWSLLQQGTWAPADDVNRFLPSIAMDSAGGIAVAYAVTGPSTSPGARVAGRSPDDPPGELANGEAELVAGEGVRPEDPSWTGDNRWGDYSALTLDPLDGCRFWFTGQYLRESDVQNPSTRIVSFRMPDCRES